MNKIYIGNLPFDVTEADLEKEFSQFGEIKEVTLIKDRFTGASKGFGFITYTANESAQKALSLDGNELAGRAMKVNIARPQEERRGGGGGGGRGGFRGDRKGGSGGGRRERW